MTLASSSPFVASAGSVTGRDHRRACRDGQDGFALVTRHDVTAAIVTDGCSSGRTSEVGARLGAAWIADLVARTFPSSTNPEQAAKDVTAGLVEHLRTTARSLSHRGERERDDIAQSDIARNIIGEMLLFGFLAAVVTADTAIVFGVGDGMAWIDGTSTVIDPGPENAPIYPAYALLGATIAPRILHVGDANAFETIAIATDGAEELLNRRTETPTDANDANDAFAALVRDDRLFTNPSLLRKRLLVLSDRGLFWDDTTIGIVRRTSTSRHTP